MRFIQSAKNSALAMAMLSLGTFAQAEVTGPITLSVSPLAPGQTEVLAWSWGASNSSTVNIGAGGGAGKAQFQDISLTRYTDRYSPLFIGAVAQGTALQEVTISRQGLEVRLENVILTSYSVGGVNDKKAPQTENISLSAEKVCFNAEGSSDFCFNVAENTTF